MAVTYDIKAHPTVYNGRQYRSRLEAKWAAFFDLLGWKHEYEPIDFGEWSPDFALIGAEGPVYVEVKPITEFDEDTARKMRSVSGEHILVGLCPWDADTKLGKAIGWFVYSEDDHPMDWGATTDQAVVAYVGGEPDIISGENSYKGRLSGLWDGDHFLSPIMPEGLADAAWRRASNAVQWRPR